uniref:Uncharacterized protein n=1 Tax=Panagrellus redivivus TaxID=6233 RepID=A0A7E4ZZJ6_PANRE
MRTNEPSSSTTVKRYLGLWSHRKYAFPGPAFTTSLLRFVSRTRSLFIPQRCAKSSSIVTEIPEVFFESQKDPRQPSQERRLL